MTRPTRALFAAPRRYLVLPAVGLALLAERLCADARASGAVGIPSQAWALFALAAVLFAVAMGRPPRLGFATAPPYARSPARARPASSCSRPGSARILAAPLFWVINAATEDAPAGEPRQQRGLAALDRGLAAIRRRLRAVGAAGAHAARGTASRPAGRPAATPGRVGAAGGSASAGAGAALARAGDDPARPLVRRSAERPRGRATAGPRRDARDFRRREYADGRAATVFPRPDLRVLPGTPSGRCASTPALAGAAIAPLLYLLAARLYGWRVGLAAGALVALSAWNITFSRLGLLSMGTVVFNVPHLRLHCAGATHRAPRLLRRRGCGARPGLADVLRGPAGAAVAAGAAGAPRRGQPSGGSCAPCAAGCWCSRWARRSRSYLSACSPYSSRPCSPGG